MADKHARGRRGYGKRTSVRRLQLVIGGYFAYVIAVSSVTWLFVGKHSMSLWALLVGGPLLLYAARGPVLDLTRPLIRGVSGGGEVARILEPLLAKGYEVMHHVDLGRGSVDHVVIGPTGVYAIETKGWLGRFSLAKSGRLMCSGLPADKVRDQAITAATRVRNRLFMCGMDEFVTAVVALTRASVRKGPLSLRPGYAIEAQALESWISRRMPNLQPPDVGRVRAALSSHVSA